MIRHLARLLWNRRRHNILVVAEIFVAFLVLFVVVTLAVQAYVNSRTPLGFDFKDRWDLTFDRPPGEWDERGALTLRQLQLALRQFPEVQAFGGVDPSPYSDATRISAYTRDGRMVDYRVALASDAYADVAGIEVVRGRWFSPDDDGATYEAMVISQSMADSLFPGQDPIGRNLAPDVDRDGRPRREQRVVGVFAEYRQDGEFMWPAPYAFSRTSLTSSTGEPPRNLILRLSPGADAALEAKILASLRAVAPDWTFRLRPQEDLRAEKNRQAVVPLVTAGIVAAFLMLMVFLGLSGVLWQAITQRTREIGLRRAKGATAVDIYRQLLGEIGILTTVAVAAALTLVVQLPWLDLVGGIPAPVYLASLAVTSASIYVLTLACGLYPGHLATRLSPAEALHDE